MRGIEYFFDDKGRPKAVLIDLKRNQRLWEDFQDILVARQRLKEPRILIDQTQQGQGKNGRR